MSRSPLPAASRSYSNNAQSGTAGSMGKIAIAAYEPQADADRGAPPLRIVSEPVAEVRSGWKAGTSYASRLPDGGEAAGPHRFHATVAGRACFPEAYGDVHAPFANQIDSRYRGHRLALWLLALVVLLRLTTSANTIFNTRAVATGADGIPLETMSADGARYVLLLFALPGASQLMLALQGVVVLVRYRAMAAFMPLLLLAEHGGRRMVALAPAAGSDGVPIGFYINIALLAFLLTGLVLSLLGKPPAAAKRQS